MQPIIIRAPAARRAPRRRYTRPTRSVGRLKRRYMRYVGVSGSPSDYGLRLIQRNADTLARYGPTYRSGTTAQQLARRNDGYFGQGGYMSDAFASAGQGAGKLLGQGWNKALGGGFVGDVAQYLYERGGQAIGRSVGDRVEAEFGSDPIMNRMIGAGAYSTNDLITSSSSASDIVPRFGPSMDGATVVISHREYVTDVYGPPSGTAFVNQAFQLNPGLEQTFPWLSQVAQNYDEYTLRQCIWTFRSTVTDIGSSTNGQCGTIIMATNYNSAAEPFTDKQTMMEYDSSMSGKTTEHMLHGVECDPSKLSGNVGRYIRTAPVQTGQDIKTYDHAQFNVALTNVPAGYANQSIGELWVSYTVELRKPRFYVSRGLGISRDTWVIDGSSTCNLPLVPNGSNGQLLGGQQNSLGTWLDSTSNRIYFPSGYSGNLRLRFLVGVPSTQLPTSLWTFAYSGNVEPIVDLPTAQFNGTQWNPTGFSDTVMSSIPSTPLGSQSLFLIEHHVRVGASTNGTQNYIDFNPANLSTLSAWAALDIEEYNTVLNAKQNGLNDSIVYVNEGGTVVPY